MFGIFAKVQTFIQLRKSSIHYVWLWMVRGAATEKSGCAEIFVGYEKALKIAPVLVEGKG